MKRYKTMSETMPHLEKDVARIEMLQSRIKKAMAELIDIQINDQWLNYTSESFCDLEPFGEEEQRFIKMVQKVNTSDRLY